MPNTPTEPAGTLSPALPGWLIPLSQLADSAAPTGGFSHSLGLETYVADGVVHDEPTFVCWLSAMLAGPGSTTCDALAIRLIAEALEADPDDLAQVWRIDRLLHAQALPRQVRDATVAMGARMLAIATLVAPSPWLTAYTGRIGTRRLPQAPGRRDRPGRLPARGPGRGADRRPPAGCGDHADAERGAADPAGPERRPAGARGGSATIKDAAERAAALTELDFGATLPGLEILPSCGTSGCVPGCTCP
ncbi:MAG: urease accessory UreF family protein [Micropruina glycogenica]